MQSESAPPSAGLPLWAVVLAGGASRRFGGDKLEADLLGRPLIERAVSGLPDGTRLVVVGPVRSVPSSGGAVTYVREDPPGGGPAAAMVAGLRAALAQLADDEAVIVVLPGDAPAAGEAARQLLDHLTDPASGQPIGVVSTDQGGRVQPLQLALTRSAARQLINAAGPDGAAGRSARALVAQVPGLRPVALDPRLQVDIDTRAELDRWSGGALPARTDPADLRNTDDAQIP